MPYSALEGVLSPMRLTVLRHIRRDRPPSIAALCRTMNRKYAAVHGDVATLIEAGLVERDESGRLSSDVTEIHAVIPV